MASMVYCDRVRHIVEEPRTQVAELIRNSSNENMASSDIDAGFIYLTPLNTQTQVALRVSAITSFQAVPGDGI